MVVAHAQHKIRRRYARLCAVGEQLLVIGTGVFTAHHQAMSLGFNAGSMAGETILNALAHLRIHL